VTAPTETIGTCGRCSGPIRHLGGPSWRHVGRYRDRAAGNHPADPDQNTREQMDAAIPAATRAA
jgi:hypothetical protein